MQLVRCAVAPQLLEVDPQDQEEEDGGHLDLDAQRKGKCAVIKTSTRQVAGPCCPLATIASLPRHTSFQSSG